MKNNVASYYYNRTYYQYRVPYCRIRTSTTTTTAIAKANHKCKNSRYHYNYKEI